MAVVKLGVNAKAYRNTGSWGSPTWNELTEVTGLTVNASWQTTSANRRGQRMAQAVKTVLDFNVSFKHLVTNKPASGEPGADNTAIWNAFVSDSTLDILVLNGPVTEVGAYGYRFECQVTQANEEQNPESLIVADMVLMPTPTSNSPQKALVGTGPTVTFASLIDDLTAAFA